MTKFYGKKLQTQYWCFFMGHSVCYYVRITVSPAITHSRSHLGFFVFCLPCHQSFSVMIFSTDFGCTIPTPDHYVYWLV